MNSYWEFEDDVHDILALLVNGSYALIEHRTHGVRLKADELAAVVHAYGRKVIRPPADDTAKWDVVQFANGAGWSVNVPLWTVEEGRSDLTLELTIRRDHDRFSIEVDDLHVL